LFDAFKAVDENNDGKITKDELHRVIERSGFNVTFDEINTLMDRYDKDGDGAISYTEFSDEIRPHSPYKRS
jgi:Ca2+-binding EF-hand superfamily protein